MGWFVPLAVGFALSKAGGKTDAAALGYSGTGVWTVSKVRAGAIGSLWAATVAVGNITASNLLGAYVAGAAVGTGVSYALFGKEGAKDALDFYAPGGADVTDLVTDLYKAPGRIAAITEGNRAVANNAAGMITGQSIHTPEGWYSQTSRYDITEAAVMNPGAMSHDPIYGSRYNPFTGKANPNHPLNV
jgi:hypothetical protein